MPDDDWGPRLCDAIQCGRLRPLLDDPGAGDHPDVAAIAAAVRAIDDAVSAMQARVAEAMDAAGVTARIDRLVGDRPLRSFDLEVERSEIDRAVHVVEQLGFERLAPTDPGPWRAYRATHGACAFVDRERSEFRLEVRWPTRRAFDGPLRRLTVPSAADFATVSLPERWWFGYLAVHLGRLPFRMWRRRFEPEYLGPFLVTPDSLIRPLLDFAAVRPGELVVDLGCGDGRIPITAARIGCRARGIESDADLVRRARAAVSAAAVDDRVDIVHADATEAAIDDADVVVMFLPVDTLHGLLPTVLDRVRPGARVVVHEQARLASPVAPERSAPLGTAEGITVAHLWTG